MDSTFITAEDAPPLSRSPWRFALYFYLKARKTLLGIFISWTSNVSYFYRGYLLTLNQSYQPTRLDGG